MALYGWWLVLAVTVRCDVLHFKYKHKVDVTKTGGRSGGQSITKSLVQCAALCSFQNKHCFFYERIEALCRLDVDKHHCNYNTGSTTGRKKKRALFLTLKKRGRFIFSLHILSENSPMSVNSTSELFSAEGPITDVDYHVKTHTVYWITERNAKVIFMRKVGDSETHTKRWPNPKYGPLELAIDNVNNYFFFLGKYHIERSEDLKKYHKLPFTLKHLGDNNHMALDPTNRRVFYTAPSSSRLDMWYIPYDGKTDHGLVFNTRDEMKAFVLDPSGLYVYACMKKLQRISLKTRKADHFLTSPFGQYCPMMAASNRQIFVMTSRKRKLGVAVLSMETGSVQSVMKLSIQNSLHGGHMEMLEI